MENNTTEPIKLTQFSKGAGCGCKIAPNVLQEILHTTTVYNSPNLLVAAEWVKEQGGTVIGWLGFDGGKLKSLSDIPVVVETPKGEYAPVEDVHLVINHIIVTWMQFHIINEEASLKS